MAAKQKFKMNDEQRKLFNLLTPLGKEVSLNSISGMNDIDSYKNSSGKAKNLKSMESIVSRLLRNAKVSAFIESMADHIVNPAVMSRDEMLERLSGMARTNMNDLIVWGTQEHSGSDGEMIEQSLWQIKDSAMQDPNKAASIAEVSAGKEGIKIKQHSPLAAMKQLADLAGYEAPKQIEHEVNSIVRNIDITATPEEAARAYTEMMEGK